MGQAGQFVLAVLSQSELSSEKQSSSTPLPETVVLAESVHEKPRQPATMTIKAKLYCTVIIAAGVALLGWELLHWHTDNGFRFAVYLMITLLASGLKVTLPGVNGTMSVYFLFLLLAILEMGLPEVAVMGFAATVAQTYWHAKSRPRAVQVWFNIGSTVLAVCASYGAYHAAALKTLKIESAFQLAFAAIVFFVTNTGSIATVIAITENKSPRRVWQECYFWAFPYYLVGASIACAVGFISQVVGWQTSLLVLPVVFVIYRGYRLYLGRLQDEKIHAEQMASLHLRTIEALALAIDAKDQTTHDHLQRVQVYAMEIAKELGLSKDDTAALQAAALLHDIGKLAVPEHIIAKPGKLTPEEFEKMKIHPLVGAEILDRVQFPYPVVPIVRAHHERWDGAGYPLGLKGEGIPLGARILSAVDCLDALASDRQYRRALPLDEAMKVVSSESGRSYDPRVVTILERRYLELEQKARSLARLPEPAKLSTDVRVERGSAPATGFESKGDAPAPAREGRSDNFLMSIAAARHEAQALFELAQNLGNSLSLTETLSVMAARLRRLVPFDALAIYVVRDNVLKPEYVTGTDFQLFSSLEIPIGQGLSGWVVENRKPIVNGNPSVEPGYLNDPTKFSRLRSALAVPLEGSESTIGVIALYHADTDAFSRDQLRVLLAISSKVSVSVENALKYQEAESSATTDYLTGLPNARSLFMHLDSELSRSARLENNLAVLVCDVDGFKQVNDKFGHLTGNRLLTTLAAGLRDHCREYDYVARMGGDEFVIVMPGLTPESAWQKLEELDRVTTRIGVQVCGERIISLSIGASFFPADGRDAEELLAEADRRMYKVKQERKRPRALLSLMEETQQPSYLIQ
jgi:diguanylate cyclase (GGDEF)-like protein/putative nucleotidyltransferase with HDIG domain